MRPVMLPETQAEGEPCASPKAFLITFPVLPATWDQRLQALTWAVLNVPLLGASVAVALGPPFVCPRAICTCLHKPQLL